MLLSFRVVNHRSLRDLQHLNLTPIYEADRPVGTAWPAVPVAAIYGANASGKSNLVNALGYLRDMVLNSDRKAEPGLGVARTPFRLDPEVARSPSSFDFDAVIGGTRYSYGFTVDDGEVVAEWLYRYPRKRRQVVFAREGRSYRYGTTTSADLREAEGITADNVLFMSVAARAGKSEVVPVYRWMRAMQLPNPLTEQLPARGSLLGTRLVQVAEDDARHRVVLGLLRAADLGVEDFGVAEAGEAGPRPGRLSDLAVEHEEKILFLSSRSLQKPYRSSAGRRVWFQVKGAEDGATLSLEDQSDGTLLFIDRMIDVLDVLASGSVFVIDELALHLHPNLAGHIVRIFQDPTANPHGAQLIFTSHDTSLLGSNAETLKRDQVWFVEKDHADGASRLFPLSDFKPRDTENTERRYRGGSYRAVPFVDEEAMLAAVAQFARQAEPADA
jgi:AAA domain, putative AbiEii toxin, Type IV TA system